MVGFKLFNNVIEFHDDLKKFYEIKFQFEDASSEVCDDVLFATEDKDDVERTVKFIITNTIESVNCLISNLSQYGFYDITTDDVFSENGGLELLNDQLEKFTNYIKETTKEVVEVSEAEISKAKNKAYSQVKGLDYGLITNSIIGSMYYGLAEGNALDNQKKKADNEFNIALDNISKVAKDSLLDAHNDYCLKIFVPNLIKAVNLIFSDLFKFYIKKLCECGEIDLKCIENIDCEKSKKLMKNLDIIDNKEMLFVNLVKLCPVNIDIYMKAIEYNYFNSEFSEIIKYFSISKYLIMKIEDEIYESSQTDKNVMSFCSYNKRNFEYIALFKDCTVQEIYHYYTRAYYNKLIDEVRNYFSELEAGENGNNIESEIFDEDHFEEIVQNLIFKFREILERNNIDFIKGKCGYINVEKELLSLVGYKDKMQFDIAIQSKFEEIAKKLIDVKVKKLKEKEARIVKEKIEQKEMEKKFIKLSLIVLLILLIATFLFKAL